MSPLCSSLADGLPLFVLTVVSGVAFCRFAAWLDESLLERFPKKPSVLLGRKSSQPCTNAGMLSIIPTKLDIRNEVKMIKCFYLAVFPEHEMDLRPTVHGD